MATYPKFRTPEWYARKAQTRENRKVRETKRQILREEVVRRTFEGESHAQIALTLGITQSRVSNLLKQAREKPRPAAGLPIDPSNPWGAPFSIVSPTRRARAKALEDERAGLRKACLDARARAVPFDVIAADLKLTPDQVKKLTAEALRELAQSETTHVELERRLMVQQLDGMIRAAIPRAFNLEDPDLDALDRVLKLLDRKSKLLGLDQAQSVDIMVRLQEIARENNYDIRELEDIARDVLTRHRFQLPEGAEGS